MDSLTRLLARFGVSSRVTDDSASPDSSPDLEDIFKAASGTTLDDGFYRFHTRSSARESDNACDELIAGFKGRFRCFAYDWLGREVAVDARTVGFNGQVIVVDPGGGEYLDPSTRLLDWHDAVASDADPLAYSFYREWREANPHAGPLGSEEAIGYKVPLFLGGADDVSNLEVTDRKVYFEICTQLAQQARDLPPGTSINSISKSET